MRYTNAQKLLQNIKINRWRNFCFPKKLHASYRDLPQYEGFGMFCITFFYKNKLYSAGFGCVENEEPDYEFFTRAFFRGFKRLKRKIRKGKYERN